MLEPSGREGAAKPPRSLAPIRRAPARAWETCGMSGPVSADEVRAARELLAGVTVTTPVLHSRSLSAKVGGTVAFCIF